VSPPDEPVSTEAQPVERDLAAAETPPPDAAAAEPETAPEYQSFLSSKPFKASPPLLPDGTCGGIIGVDGQCCSTVVVGGCTAEDVEADRLRKETSQRAWLESLTSAKQNHGKFPSNYAALVRKWFAGTLKDPYSARYGRISKPRKEHAIDDVFEQKALFGWSVCATVNAKNSYGAYTGNSVYWFLIVNNEIVRSMEVEDSTEIYIGRAVDCSDGP
jgi:hypothetical protein